MKQWVQTEVDRPPSPAGRFDEIAVDEGGSGADENDQMREYQRRIWPNANLAAGLRELPRTRAACYCPPGPMLRKLHCLRLHDLQTRNRPARLAILSGWAGRRYTGPARIVARSAGEIYDGGWLKDVGIAGGNDWRG